MRTILSRLRVLAGILLLAVFGACSDLLNPPAPDAPRQIAISLSSAPSAGARPSLASTFARVSAARVQVRHSGTSVLDTTLAFVGDQQEGRLRISVRQEFAREPLEVSVDLLGGSSVLFRGASTVVLDRTGATSVTVPMGAVVGRIIVDRSVPTLEAIGATTQLRGAVLFANGDTVPDLRLSWRALEAGVVEVAADGRVTARGEGQSRVEGSFETRADTVLVTVNAAVARVAVEPPSLELPVGQTGSIAATLFDSNGNRIEGRPVEWSGGPSAVVELIAPLDGGVVAVRGISAGIATVTASAGGFSAVSVVTVTNPAPVLAALSPASRVTGSEGFTLSIAGSGFVPGSTVRWNGSARSSQFMSSTEVRAIIPSSDLADSGTVAVTVSNPAPGGGISAALAFSVAARPRPVPILTAVSPSSRVVGSAGFQLTVTGQGFAPDAVVRWNEGDRATLFVSATELRAIILEDDVSEAGAAAVTVFNPGPGGGASNQGSFIVQNPVPTVASLAPATALAGSGPITVAVSGSGFTPGSSVRWNGDSRSTQFIGPEELRATILASDLGEAGTATVTVFNPAPGGGSSDGVQFTISEGGGPNPIPAITELSPSVALAGSVPIELVVRGTQFVPGAVVRWNGLDRATEFVNTGELRANITSGDLASPGVASVTVLNPPPGGGESAPRSFTITSIGLSSDSVAFFGIPGGGDPPPDSVAITSGSGPLSGLAVTIVYGAGQPTGWLSATLSATTAPAVLLLQVTPGTLPTGTYTAVVTITDGGAGERSFTVTFTYAAAVSIPNAPSSLTAVATTRNIIDLEWVDNSTNETSFEIERRSGASAYQLVATVGPNVTTFSDDPRTGSPAFTYRVRACNPVGCSAYSNEATDK